MSSAGTGAAAETSELSKQRYPQHQQPGEPAQPDLPGPVQQQDRLVGRTGELRQGVEGSHGREEQDLLDMQPQQLEEVGRARPGTLIDRNTTSLSTTTTTSLLPLSLPLMYTTTFFLMYTTTSFLMFPLPLL